MKKTILFFLVTIVSLTAFSQQKNWKEMHDFHAVMSMTYHPAEEGDLKPLKENAPELVAKAKVWQASTVPQGYNAAVAKPILKNLVGQCEKLEKLVKAGAADTELKKEITAAHEIFHELMEKCKEKK